MKTITKLPAALLASAIGLSLLAGAAEARVTRAYDPTSTGSLTSMPDREYQAGHDTDSGNAKNPALPDYAQARGQETGGYARNLIPN